MPKLTNAFVALPQVGDSGRKKQFSANWVSSRAIAGVREEPLLLLGAAQVTEALDIVREFPPARTA